MAGMSSPPLSWTVPWREARLYEGPFFAYIHNIREDHTARYILIFATRDVADEWWRVISTAETSNGQSLNIQRVAPQFYTHDPHQRFNVADFFTDSHLHAISSPFRGKLFVTLDNDRGGRGISIIPLHNIVDHTSGSWFTIRSKADPRKYWYYNAESEHIVISSVYRTSFQISTTEDPDGTIMVGKDEVTISVENEGYVACLAPNQPVTRTLGIEFGPANTFKFEDFKYGRFFSELEEASPICYSRTNNHRSWELAL